MPRPAMGTVFEIAGAVVLLVLGVLVARRFPDTRAGFGKDLDDAPVRSAWRQGCAAVIWIGGVVLGLVTGSVLLGAAVIFVGILVVLRADPRRGV